MSVVSILTTSAPPRFEDSEKANAMSFLLPLLIRLSNATINHAESVSYWVVKSMDIGNVMEEREKTSVIYR